MSAISFPTLEQYGLSYKRMVDGQYRLVTSHGDKTINLASYNSIMRWFTLFQAEYYPEEVKQFLTFIPQREMRLTGKEMEIFWGKVAAILEDAGYDKSSASYSAAVAKRMGIYYSRNGNVTRQYSLLECASIIESIPDYTYTELRDILYENVPVEDILRLGKKMPISFFQALYGSHL